MEKTGEIFDIMKYSIHDGPGIRNTVFTKGCPLDCWWCHNPESQSLEAEVMVYPRRCIGCGECFKVCEDRALERIDNKMSIDRDKCTNCYKCTEVCYAEALVKDSRLMKVSEIIEEVIKDKEFYETSKGGVTISGGEPFVQTDFILELLKELKNEDIHTTLDTSGYTREENILKTKDYIDLYLYDIKFINPERHKKYTGVDNSTILNNLKLLLENEKNVQIRIPIIPSVNDDEVELYNIRDFINSLPNKNYINKINILPYHKIGEEKYNRLQREYKMSGVPEPSDELMEKVKKLMETTNIQVKIGG